MKAIYVNSLTKEITEVDIAHENNLAEKKKLIGSGHIAIYEHKHNDITVLMDESAMLKNPKTVGYFILDDKLPVIGNALLYGKIKHNKLTDTTLNLTEAKAIVEFATFDRYQQFVISGK